MTQQPLLGQSLVIIKVSRSHSDTPHSVGLLLTIDQPDAETSTWQHTKPTRGRHLCLRRDTNPIPANERLHTRVLDCAATGIDIAYIWEYERRCADGYEYNYTFGV